MASRIIKATAYGADSRAPLTGLAPTWALYKDAANADADLSSPAIAEIGTSGKYKATVVLTAGQSLAARLDFGATADPRYVDIDLDYAELVAPADAAAVDAQLSDSHGSGLWGGASGDGSQTVAFTALVSGSGIPGARVDAFAGTTLMATGTTSLAGVVTFALDVGSYTFKTTLTGYQWAPTTVVVTAPNIATPANMSGVATVDVDAGTAPTGLSGALACGSTVTGALAGLNAGDSYTLTRSVSGNSSRAISKAWLTFKLPADKLGPDGNAIVRKLAATVDAPGTGQIVDAGNTGGLGSLRFDLSGADTRRLGRLVAYDVKVLLADGSLYTLEIGTTTPAVGPTSAVS